jgi:hypothetical protein
MDRIPIALLLLTLLGCGYRFVDERAVFADARRIQLVTFENRSTEPGYEQMLVDAISEEFVRRGALRPVYGAAQGELVMRGEIRQVRVRASSFSSVALAVEDRVEIQLDIAVTRAADDELVWERENFEFSELFLSSPDPQVYESNKEQALRRLSALIAERIHDELFQRF